MSNEINDTTREVLGSSESEVSEVVDKNTSLYSRLSKIQRSINSLKNNYNEFAKFKYRTVDDILLEVKRFMQEEECIIVDSEIVFLHNRFYVKATAMFTNGKDTITASGYSREPESRNNMDTTQLTVSATTYATKVALMGLFAIHGGEDPDKLDNTNNNNNTNKQTYSIISYKEKLKEISEGNFVKKETKDKREFLVLNKYSEITCGFVQEEGNCKLNIGSRLKPRYISIASNNITDIIESCKEHYKSEK